MLTLAPTISTSRERGFTLIELLVVIGLIGLISVFALPSIGSFFKLSLNSATRQIASVVKETYNSTAMSGKVHRIVFDFKAGQYWSEVGPSDLLLETEESRIREARRKRLGKKDEASTQEQFTLDRGVTRKKVTLPRGVDFEDVITEQSLEPVTEGKATMHFFPNGITEQAIIHLRDLQKNQVSLIISPIIGRTQLVNGYVKSLEEAARVQSR